MKLGKINFKGARFGKVKLNRKGDAGDATMLFSFILLAVIIASGISIGVFGFFGQGYDFRGTEAKILKFKFEKCLSSNGEAFGGVVDDESFKEFVFGTCGFHSNVMNEHLIYFKPKGKEGEFFVGVLDYLNQCDFVGGEGNKNFPVCVDVYDEKGLFVFGSSQEIRRVLVDG